MGQPGFALHLKVENEVEAAAYLSIPHSYALPPSKLRLRAGSLKAANA
jgi:hypothetical protein